MTLPSLVVFDLDFTLWDCGGTWCDCLSPPFRLQDSRVWDRDDRNVCLYDDIDVVLDRCDAMEIPMALASRTEQPTWARELVQLLGIADRFTYEEIYPSSKLRHFDALQRSSHLSYDQMLFFDDEMRNIKEVSGLGVTCIHVRDGVTTALFESGLDSMP